ncbi:glycosyltransferase family A protein [Novosphingobium malaysiense]|uniref:Glycosyl transferase n=1 Tax=Novosphingobium malaysiense TaxID=1348853 RepID=A0A0B1ZNZ4_9SPHN|nr:glycosyltransferase family A protein [Novosphingobium malaysiense]KHK92870.1 glycosyl transferase [Novosphingobium malaysiense]
MPGISNDLSVAVVIASLGRPDLLDDIIARMAQQTRKPDLLLFSTVTPQDLPDSFVETDTVKAIFGPKGLTRQRNAALDYLGDRFDVIVFYDDDFVPSRFSVENAALFFRAHPEVAGATGNVLADGINNAGIGKEDAERIVARYDESHEFSAAVERELVGLYGCNMAYRSSAIGNTRFDERLRLYAWQEDIDFAFALNTRGKIVKTRAFAGVHQGLKHGRTPGLRLGYSQVINPLYLAAKGTMPKGFALKLLLKNVLANHLKMFRPEPWVDRKGRAKGNWAGLFDALRGRLTPERIEDL